MRNRPKRKTNKTVKKNSKFAILKWVKKLYPKNRKKQVKLFRPEDINPIVSEDDYEEYFDEENEQKLCLGIRLEDFQPCQREPFEDGDYCKLHSDIRFLLEGRRRFFNNCSKEWYSWEEKDQFLDFVDEHFYKIFPMLDTNYVFNDRINLSQEIWLNKNNFVIWEPKQCRALNLRNGNICGNGRYKNDFYCERHGIIKSEHAYAYHFFYAARYGFPFYQEYYQNKAVDSFHRTYLEFFMRMEHGTIYQLEFDRRHHDVVKSLVNQMQTLEEMLPDRVPFYRALYKKFCKKTPDGAFL